MWSARYVACSGAQGRAVHLAATGVLAPLASANAEHAAQLLSALGSTPLSTRELHTWFQHYQSTPRAGREHMVDHPRLFIEAVQVRDEQRADARLREGPEGQCAAEVRQLLALIKRLRERLLRLRPELLPEPLVSALTRLRTALEALQGDLARFCDDPSQIRDAVRTLQAQGRSLREISRVLKQSRNTVRRTLRASLQAAEEPASHGIGLTSLQSAFARAQGNVARVQ